VGCLFAFSLETFKAQDFNFNEVQVMYFFLLLLMATKSAFSTVNRGIKKFFHYVQQQTVERLCGKGRK
jgi:hypothetical protein